MSAERPAPGPARPYHFPRFYRRTLANDLRLVVVPVHKLPLVTVLALVDAGAVRDPRGHEGLAQLTAHLHAEGTTALDGIALADRFERLGTAFDASADWDATVAGLTVVSERLPEALDLFAEVLTSPAFPEREVERLKAERLSDLLQLRTEPRGLADEMFSRFVYASRARYARPDGGDEESVKAIGVDDVRTFYEERYGPATTTLIVVGDVSLDRATVLAERTLGSWRRDAQRGGRDRAVDQPAFDERRVHLVAKADAPQSEIRAGHVGVPRVHPDYFPIVVMNMVLGGLFNSRINLNLREEHAYTYGAFSGFDWRVSAGPFEVSTAVQSDVTAAAAAEVLKEIDRIRASDIEREELSLATSYLDGVFPIRYETTGAIARALASVEIFGLPDDYFDTYRDKIRAVTLADVRRVAEEHLRPDRLQLVVVGDPDAVRIPLEGMGVGPLTVYDAEGKEMG
jgi:zinc protease